MKKYLLLILLSASLKNVSAQMYLAGTVFQSYFDIDPDTLLNYVISPYTNETFGISMFDDSSTDILFTARGAASSSGSSAYISVASLNPNVYIMFGRLDSVYIPATSGWDVTKIAKPLIVTDPIDASDAVWDNGTLYLTDYSGHGGGNKAVSDWVGSEKYIGIKYEIGSSTSYGWIRLKCPSADSCYIKDISNSQVSIGVHEISPTHIDLFPNPSHQSFYLKDVINYSFDSSRFSITNIFGQKIKASYEFSGKDLKINPDNNLPAGFYFIKYSSEEFMLTKKFVRALE